VAALLISVTRNISPLWLFVITPLMLVLFFTHRWATERVENSERHLVEMKRTFLQTIEALALAIDAKTRLRTVTFAASSDTPWLLLRL